MAVVFERLYHLAEVNEPQSIQQHQPSVYCPPTRMGSKKSVNSAKNQRKYRDRKNKKFKKYEAFWKSVKKTNPAMAVDFERRYHLAEVNKPQSIQQHQPSVYCPPTRMGSKKSVNSAKNQRKYRDRKNKKFKKYEAFWKSVKKTNPAMAVDFERRYHLAEVNKPQSIQQHQPSVSEDKSATEPMKLNTDGVNEVLNNTEVVNEKTVPVETSRELNDLMVLGSDEEAPDPFQPIKRIFAELNVDRYLNEFQQPY